MPTTTTSIATIRSRLALAKKLLAVAGAIQILPFLLRAVTGPFGPGGMKFFWLAVLSSALLNIVGFLIVYLQLNLADDAVANSPMRGLLGPRLQLGLVLGFLLAFFIPVISLAIVIFAYFKAQSALHALDKFEAETAILEARRRRVTGNY